MKTTHERFLDKLEPPNERGCTEWNAYRDAKGYGAFYFDGKVGRAHRYALERKIGRKLSVEELACHTCDNPPCANENHLFVGTNSDNVQDAIKKGRFRNGNTRKTHCGQGHEFTVENTRVDTRGSRVCRTCDRDNTRKRRAAKNERRLVYV